MNLLPKRGSAKTTIMNTKTEPNVMMLLYRIKRYQAMGDGIKCQQLISQLNRLKKNVFEAQA